MHCQLNAQVHYPVSNHPRAFKKKIFLIHEATRITTKKNPQSFLLFFVLLGVASWKNIFLNSIVAERRGDSRGAARKWAGRIPSESPAFRFL